MIHTKVDDVIPKSGGGFLCCLCGSVTTFILVILFGPATVTQLGQFKIGLAKHKFTGVVDFEHVFEPGRYWIGFWKEFIEFPTTLQTIQFSDERPEDGVQQLSVLRSRDKEGKQIFLDISVQYRLMPKMVGQVYKEMTNMYEDVYISELRDVLSKAGNKFKVSEAWENYNSVTKLMHDSCIAALKPRHADCWGLQLWGVRLESTYEQALIRTQVRKQAQRTEEKRKVHAEVRAKTQVLLAEFRKNITIVQSQGTAKVFRIEREAKAKAEQALIQAQADSIQLAKELIVLPNNNTLRMTDQQLIRYQRLLMLSEAQQTEMVVHPAGSYLEAVNIKSASDLMSSD
eukprot:TRINITY_DN98554_c0_g1_i1.p1 TRINITY_DN98554_c0_g1~~TRINITY_DN98554_c0_g1_i1.p1  ORF type:complete len:343 (-),score=77.64 TRINITY_DN98554_c0_g1_i1:158-1186(-)